MNIAAKTWDKKKQAPHPTWRVVAKKLMGRKAPVVGRKKLTGGKHRGMPFRMAGFKSANSWLDKLIGVVKTAVAQKPKLRGSDHLQKHKLKLDALERKLDQGIVILKRKEADEDKSRAERAKAKSDRQAAQAAKKAVGGAKARVIEIINAQGGSRRAHLEKGESEAEYENRSRRGVAGPRRPDRWVDGDMNGRKGKKGKKKSSTKKKSGSKKKSSSKHHAKGKKRSAKAKSKSASDVRAYWRDVFAGKRRRKGFSLAKHKKSGSKKSSAKRGKSKKKSSSRRDWSGARFGRDWAGSF